MDETRPSEGASVGGADGAVSRAGEKSKAAPPPFEIVRPARRTSAVVYASPHSGDYYPAEFIARSRLDPESLRKSEDSFVDALFQAAPEHGSPLLRARYARVYVDVNREPYELDPGMFDAPLPAHSNTTSLRVAGGLGTIARVVADGAEVYADKLPLAEAEARLGRVYHPYHAALAALLSETRTSFGHAVLIDCHSMPSVGGGIEGVGGRGRPDIVLGDRFATAAAPALVDFVEAVLGGLGYAVGRNTPYAGGFTTHHYGRPATGLHALQIEINRGLYMDEARYRRGPGFASLAADLTTLIGRLSDLDPIPAMAAE